MKTLYAIVIALFLMTATQATAQVLHVSQDPVLQTRGCQNHRAAIHENNDVVMVDYHGQWRTNTDGRRIQNGGSDHSACAIERIVRLNSQGGTVWEVRPEERPGSLGFSRNAEVTGVAALPDGSTALSVSEGEDTRHSVVTLVGPDGRRLWSVATTRAPKFGQAKVFGAESGELFVSFLMTNYAYEGGVFQLPGGKAWTLRRHERKSLVVRLDPATGRLLWEQEAGDVVLAARGELLLIQRERRSSESRYRLQRRDYNGKTISSAWTQWFERESMVSATRVGERIVMTLKREQVDASASRVLDRRGVLRVFDLSGRSQHVRMVSDGARVLVAREGATVHVVSPIDCDRSHDDVGCRTTELEVLTLNTLDDEGVTSRLKVSGFQFDYDDFEGVSMSDGVWVNARVYDEMGRRAVIVQRSLDAERRVVPPAQFVWKPIPPRSSSSSRGSGFPLAF